MEISKMSRRNLNKWVKNLELWLKTETNDHNIELYSRWLAEARYEQRQRDTRKDRYLRWKNGK